VRSGSAGPGGSASHDGWVAGVKRPLAFSSVQRRGQTETPAKSRGNLATHPCPWSADACAECAQP
jgi:hypothetical protein